VSNLSAPVFGYTPSFICPHPDDRERFRDMNRRMLRTQNLLMLLFVLLVPALLMAYRPLPAGIALGALVTQSALQRQSDRFARPEIPFGIALVIALLGATLAIVWQGREHSGDLIILVWPAVTAYSRFPTRAAHALTGLAIALMLIAQVAFAPAGFLHQPSIATLPIVALVAVAGFAAAVRSSDARHRQEAVVDELTGLLNRSALRSRVAELQAQSALAGESVGLILADLDHFKAVNDDHGHLKGDEVLIEVAARLRQCLRAYDSMYRIGGEELAVLVPGASAAELTALSERLCVAVHDEPVAGLPLTISVGAARSRPGSELSWDELYRAADRALYRAKADGRDRVALG
jgi:diguanylate cyclase (GGDEF)-like protein